jgi:hypothetical protein
VSYSKLEKKNLDINQVIKQHFFFHYFKLLVTSPFHDIIEIQKETDQAEHEKTKKETIEMMSKQKTILFVGYFGEFLYNFI